MTAIAYRSGTMAADGLDSCGSIVVSLCARKLGKRADGALMGAAGDTAACVRLMAAFMAGTLADIEPTRDKDNPYAAIVVEPDGTVFRLTETCILYPMPEAPFHTEGCAYQILTGAMAAGASAEEAVRIAIQWDTRCGGEIQVERLG